MRFCSKILAINLAWAVGACSQTMSVGVQNVAKSTIPQNNSIPNMTEDQLTNSDSKFSILENTIQSSNFRRISLVLDEHDFQVDTLTEVFSKLSEEFQNPKYLTIGVNTDRSLLTAIRQRPGTGSSRIPKSPENEKENRAIYYRRGPNEFFRYRKKDKSDYVTVVLKGKAI